MHSADTALAQTMSIHFVIMYALSCLLADQLSHAYVVSTRLMCLTFVVVTLMVFLMVFFMRSMVPNQQRNRQLLAGSAIIFVLAIIDVRAHLESTTNYF